LRSFVNVPLRKRISFRLKWSTCFSEGVLVSQEEPQLSDALRAVSPQDTTDEDAPRSVTVSAHSLKLASDFHQPLSPRVREIVLVVFSENSPVSQKSQFANLFASKVYREQILCFWTLSIILFLSKTPPCLYFKTQRFRRLRSVSVFR
jgi:hypothetical protein